MKLLLMLLYSWAKATDQSKTEHVKRHILIILLKVSNNLNNKTFILWSYNNGCAFVVTCCLSIRSLVFESTCGNVAALINDNIPCQPTSLSSNSSHQMVWRIGASILVIQSNRSHIPHTETMQQNPVRTNNFVHRTVVWDSPFDMFSYVKCNEFQPF